MKIRYSLLAVAVASSAFVAEAKPRTQAEIMSAAKSELVKAVPDGARYATNLKTLHQTSNLTIVGFEGRDGFAVVANDDINPAVLGVSDSHFSNGDNLNFQWWLQATEAVCAENVANGSAPRTVPTPDDLGFPECVDPLVSSEWDQDSPYWDKCPTRYGSRCLTGCVATAIAQVFYTNQYPRTGTETSRTNTSASSVTFNYGEAEFKYENMLDKYVNGNWTAEQADAVATLMLACGVAVNMDYSPNASGAYSDQAADGIRTYFGVETAHLVERDYYSDEEWMELVYTELAGGHPMYYSSVDQYGQGGHAYVCDGYDELGRVHMNWGWSGEDNGFFSVDMLNPSYYHFNLYQDMILGMYDPDDNRNFGTLVADTVMVETPGSLITLIDKDLYSQLSGLKIEGQINDEDIAFMRELVACDTLRINNIDLTDAAVEGNALPAEAFSGSKLRSIMLPRGLESIGERAFNGCSRLARVRSYTYDVPATGKNCFDGVKATQMTAYLIAGSSDNYKRNAQWKAFCTTDHIVEFGTCIKANTVNRKYGAANPVLGYKLIGDRVNGVPKLSCSATAESPVGRYEITIEPGTITETLNVVYVNGNLQVLKAQLDVTVADAVRAVGEENPEFELSYSGFVNGEDESVLNVLPTVFCSATAESPAGEYVIEVKGAEADNYTIKYHNGTLTVSEATGIADAQIVSQNGAQIFTILGEPVKCSRISDLTPGMYIIDGRKTVVRR